MAMLSGAPGSGSCSLHDSGPLGHGRRGLRHRLLHENAGAYKPNEAPSGPVQQASTARILCGWPWTNELLNKVTWKITNALALIGSRSGDERNAMTAGWITQLSMEPVLIGVSVDNEAVTAG